MLPQRIILIRHAQSEANHNPEIYSQKLDHEHNLTELGREQAQDAGKQLSGLIGKESYGVFVSPYNRTMQTMEIACRTLEQTQKFVRQDLRLREQDYGPIVSMETSVAHRAQRELNGRLYYRFPGGESCADIYDRISTFLESLFRSFKNRNSPENILIFTHGTAMKCFLMRWYYWTSEKFNALPDTPPNCHFAVMLRDPDTEDYKLTEPFQKVFTND